MYKVTTYNYINGKSAVLAKDLSMEDAFEVARNAPYSESVTTSVVLQCECAAELLESPFHTAGCPLAD